MISPVSISCDRKNVVTPVSFSPLIIAQLIGAAPRYWGSNEPCKLNVPILGISQIALGNIRNATTINKSALRDSNSEIKSSSFKFIGCKTRSEERRVGKADR